MDVYYYILAHGREAVRAILPRSSERPAGALPATYYIYIYMASNHFYGCIIIRTIMIINVAGGRDGGARARRWLPFGSNSFCPKTN